jgi:hypothetical protein
VLRIVLDKEQCPSLEYHLRTRPVLLRAPGPGPKHRFGQVSGLERNV